MKGFLIALFQKEWLKLWEQQQEIMRYLRGDYRTDPRRPRTVEVWSGPEPVLSLSMQLCLFPLPNLGLATIYNGIIDFPQAMSGHLGRSCLSRYRYCCQV